MRRAVVVGPSPELFCAACERAPSAFDALLVLAYQRSNPRTSGLTGRGSVEHETGLEVVKGLCREARDLEKWLLETGHFDISTFGSRDFSRWFRCLQ